MLPAIRAGATGYLLKDSAREDLQAHLSRVYATLEVKDRASAVTAT